MVLTKEQLQEMRKQSEEQANISSNNCIKCACYADNTKNGCRVFTTRPKKCWAWADEWGKKCRIRDIANYKKTRPENEIAEAKQSEKENFVVFK